MADYKEIDVPDQAGKTALVTGANTGIGYDAARVLAERGARVLIGCRSEEKALAAIRKIEQQSPHAELKWIKLDLADLESIQLAASEINRETRLDLLINNAGVMVPPKTLTKDGFELQFGVNHLGHFSLTGQVVEKIRQTPGSRIVNVSSNAHKGGEIFYDDLNAEKNYSRVKRYQMSKFANILFTYALQRRLSESGSSAISVACHPGGSATELGRHIPWFFGILLAPLSLIMNSSAEGALPTLMAATMADISGGDYFGPMKWGEMAHSAHKVNTDPASRDIENAEKLWAVSEDMTGIKFDFGELK
ncbi:MAG: oxidoreductase [Gammaproteobacteria bacterium]|nr:oxidoreductase [Gammaproteobacteria bacterium]